VRTQVSGACRKCGQQKDSLSAPSPYLGWPHAAASSAAEAIDAFAATLLRRKRSFAIAPPSWELESQRTTKKTPLANWFYMAQDYKRFAQKNQILDHSVGSARFSFHCAGRTVRDRYGTSYDSCPDQSPHSGFPHRSFHVCGCKTGCILTHSLPFANVLPQF